MSDRPPELDDLIGEVDAEERDRLARVHALLVDAGPPPELPPYLAETPPEPQAHVLPFPRRYRYAALGAAAAIAVVVFGAGYAIGRARQPAEAFTEQMTGPRSATAELVVFAQDAAGNWPMKLTVEGLPVLPRTKHYELWLTRDGRLVEPCGTFAVAPGETEVPLNAPYRLRDYDGWVVVVHGSTTPVLRTKTV